MTTDAGLRAHAYPNNAISSSSERSRIVPRGSFDTGRDSGRTTVPVTTRNATCGDSAGDSLGDGENSESALSDRNCPARPQRQRRDRRRRIFRPDRPSVPAALRGSSKRAAARLCSPARCLPDPVRSARRLKQESQVPRCASAAHHPMPKEPTPRIQRRRSVRRHRCADVEQRPHRCGDDERRRNSSVRHGNDRAATPRRSRCRRLGCQSSRRSAAARSHDAW